MMTIKQNPEEKGLLVFHVILVFIFFKSYLSNFWAESSESGLNPF